MATTAPAEPAPGQFRHAVAAIVRHPDVRAVKGHAGGIGADGDGAQHRPRTGQQPGHVVATLVHHPDVRPVVGDSAGVFPTV